MTFEEFRDSLHQDDPPGDLSLGLTGLWWDAKGDWEKAHCCAQEQDDAFGAWVHAYLHRKEGDAANAGYWYHRAARPASTVTLDSEWMDIVRALFADPKRSASAQP